MRALQRFQPSRRFYHSSPGLNPDHWVDISFLDRWIFCAKAFQFLEEKNPNFQLHAFVMMSTHFHILYSCLNLEEQYTMEELDHILLGLLRESSQNLCNFISGSTFDLPIVIESISNYQQLLNTYRYIYRNPLEAGLSIRVEDYCYSTLSEVMGRSRQRMNSVDLLHVIQNPIKILSWLNSLDSKRLYDHVIASSV